MNLIKSWIKLRDIPADKKRLAIILSNYPNKDSRIGNGVGLDTPASAISILRALRKRGYLIKDIPKNSASLMKMIKKGQQIIFLKVTKKKAKLLLA